MKFVIEKYNVGDIREKKKFAFFPIIVKYSDATEIRWLEHCTVEQIYNGEGRGWSNYKFIDNE